MICLGESGFQIRVKNNVFKIINKILFSIQVFQDFDAERISYGKKTLRPVISY